MEVDLCESCGKNTLDEEGFAIHGTKGINGVRQGVVYSYTLCPDCGGGK